MVEIRITDSEKVFQEEVAEEDEEEDDEIVASHGIRK